MKFRTAKITIINIAFAFALFSQISLFAQNREEQISSGVNYIYHIKFDSAKYVFGKIIKSEPANPTGYFFLSMIEWWKININRNDESNDDKFLNAVSKVIEIADKNLDVNDNDFNSLFFKGGALGYRGLLRSLRDSWLKAAEDGKEALNLLSRASEVSPNNKDALLGIGIYNYFAEYVPESYPALKPLMLIFPKGDKVKGLLQIKECLTSGHYAKYEAKYILTYIYLLYEKDYAETEIYSRALNTEFPENPLFEKYLCNSYVGEGKWTEAIDGWKKILQKSKDSVAGFTSLQLKREANYYVALSLFRSERILESEIYLEDCRKITEVIDKEDTALGVFTYLLLGMFSDAKNDRNSAKMYYNKVLKMKEFQNSRAEAERMMK